MKELGLVMSITELGETEGGQHKDLKTAAGRFRRFPDILPVVFVYGN